MLSLQCPCSVPAVSLQCLCSGASVGCDACEHRRLICNDLAQLLELWHQLAHSGQHRGCLQCAHDACKVARSPATQVRARLRWPSRRPLRPSQADHSPDAERSEGAATVAGPTCVQRCDMGHSQFGVRRGLGLERIKLLSRTRVQLGQQLGAAHHGSI